MQRSLLNNFAHLRIGAQFVAVLPAEPIPRRLSGLAEPYLSTCQINEFFIRLSYSFNNFPLNLGPRT